MRLLRTLLLLAGMATLAACASSGDEMAGGTVVPARQAIQDIPQQASEPPPAAVAPTRHAYTVQFDYDSAEIRASAMQILHGAAQIAKQVGPATIRITGYTDARGRKSYNQKLSERRAAAVVDQFRKLGVDIRIVEVKGLGAADPIVRSNGKAQRNRRVEISFEGAPARTAMPAQTISPASLAAVPVVLKPAFAPPSPLITPAGVTEVQDLDRQSVPLRTHGKTAIKRDRARNATTDPPPASPDA